MTTEAKRVGRLIDVHPVLMAADVAQSVRFFESLGFGLCFLDSEVEPRYAVVRRDGAEIHLQWNDAVLPGSTEDRPTYRFLVQDVDLLFSEFQSEAPGVLGSREVTPWYQPDDTPWGTREFHIHDPAGNGLQFYQARRSVAE